MPRRAFGTSGRVGGARHVGMRALIMEVDSVDELEQIASRLDSRGALVRRAHGDDWTAVVGSDPDRLAVITNCSLGPDPISTGHWSNLTEVIYGVGE